MKLEYKFKSIKILDKGFVEIEFSCFLSPSLGEKSISICAEEHNFIEMTISELKKLKITSKGGHVGVWK